MHRVCSDLSLIVTVIEVFVGNSIGNSELATALAARPTFADSESR